MHVPVQHSRTVMYQIGRGDHVSAKYASTVLDVSLSSDLSSKTAGGGMSYVNMCVKVWWQMFKPVHQRAARPKRHVGLDDSIGF